MQQRVVIAGGSGFLGAGLARALAGRGYGVTLLSRTPRPPAGAVRTVAWGGVSLGDWWRELDGAAAVVNLTGRSVACLYTPENRREIVASRVNAVRVIDEAIARCAAPPAALVQAGSLAIYGDPGERICDEDAPHGQGFGAEVCERWEEAFQAGRTPRTRRSLLRIGFALGRNGGALQPLARLARCFLGGRAGDGRQYISWLHVDDLNEMFLRAIERPEVVGAYNATGPNPVTNAEFMRELRRVLGRPWSPPTPAWAVRLGARWIVRADASLALTGRRCVPRRFLAQGLVFRHPALPAALGDLLARGSGVPPQ